MSDAARYLRQILLPEIGAAGQARLAASSAAVAGEGLAHEIGAMYARGAGFGAVTAGSIDIDVLAPAALCETPVARAVLAGSRAALAAIRAATRGDAG